MNAPVKIFPMDLKGYIRSYRYDEARFEALENHILNRMYDYDDEYGPQLLKHLQTVSRNMQTFMLHEGYNKEDALKVSRAYLLHDAGKTLQDVSIWKFKEKKSDRTAEENAQRPLHGKLGVNVLMQSMKEVGSDWTEDDIRHIELIKYLMVTHHERLDGSGPEGFRDFDMDKILRMATIVDAIDGKRKIKSMSEIFEDMTGSKHLGQFDLYLVERYREIPGMDSIDTFQPKLANIPNP